MPGRGRLAGLGTLAVVLLAMVSPAAPLAEGRLAREARAGASMPVAMSFRSQTFRPAAVSTSSDPDRGSGDIFLTPRNGYQRRVSFDRGPMIVDGKGQLVWFRPLGSLEANNLEVQQYQGKPVLTWWQGTASGGHAQDMILNTSYQTVAVVRAVGAGYQADTHEFQITPQNTALIDVVVPVRTDLTAYGGPRNGIVDDCLIQDIDIKTGHLIWSWHALGHIPLAASYTRPVGSSPWDYFHLNSIQQLPDGNLVISARNTWGVYEIDKQTGGVVWTVGGRRSNFSVGKLARFEWQHDAHLTGDTLSLFDDASDGPEQQEPESSAKTLILNFSTRTAVLDERYAHAPSVVSVSQGNAQTLPDHNVFVGWGSAPEFSEFTPGGRQIFNGTFALGVESYRAYRFPWDAQPDTPPSMANFPGSSGAVTVYASWNGATTVSAWRVLGGPTPGSLNVLDPSTAASGFETAIRLHSEPPYFEVQALGSHGQVLGTSDPHADRPHLAIFTPAAFVNSSGGQTGIPVGCSGPRTCTVRVTITSGHTTLAQTTGAPLSSNSGSLVGLRLSASAQHELEAAPGHHLQAQVSVRDSVGDSASTHMTLIRYSTAGSGPPRSLSDSPPLEIMSSQVFVTSSGRGGILAGCYGGGPCHPQATLTVDGTVIGTSPPEHLGADELGEVYVQLNPAGKLMMEQAAGNQLGADLKLTSGPASATAQVDLIGYS